MGRAIRSYVCRSSGGQFSLASSNTEDKVRLDILANGFWGGWCEKIYIDIYRHTLFLTSFQQAQFVYSMQPIAISTLNVKKITLHHASWSGLQVG